jgi:hypothetical protein
MRPLLSPFARYSDLTNYIDKTDHLQKAATALGHVSSGEPVFAYPAPAVIVYKLLNLPYPGHAIRTYLLFLGICMFCFTFILWRSAYVRTLSTAGAILTTVLLGYPMWMNADRGNIECVVWAISASGLYLLMRSRNRTGAVLIGIAASIKPFPILFLLLLLRKGKNKKAGLKEVTYGLVTLCLVTIASLVALGPNPIKAFREMSPAVAVYAHDYIGKYLPYDESRFYHSLLDGMKSATRTVEPFLSHPENTSFDIKKLAIPPANSEQEIKSRDESVPRIIIILYPLVALIGIGTLLIAFYNMPLLNQVTALCVAVTLFPMTSADYTLLHLYLPFAAFLVFLTRDVATGKVDFPYSSSISLLVIYGLLISPLTFLGLFAGDAKLILLITLLVVSARSPMYATFFSGSKCVEATSVREQRPFPIIE